jgi:hypothetical protein
LGGKEGILYLKEEEEVNKLLLRRRQLMRTKVLPDMKLLLIWEKRQNIGGIFFQKCVYEIRKLCAVGSEI